MLKRVGVFNDDDGSTLVLSKSPFERITHLRAKILSRIASSFVGYFFLSFGRYQLGWNEFLSQDIQDQQTLTPFYSQEEENDGEETDDEDLDFKTLINSDGERYFKTISDYHLAYINKTSTPLEVAKTLISNSKKKHIMDLNAIVEIHEDEILRDAEESTERYNNGSQLSVVDGVPFFVKEEFLVEGYTSKFGTTHINKTSSETSYIIKKLRHNGALFCGITNMVALGSNPVGFNASPVRPSCRNPWNTDYYCGGSSSGSAAIVAAGLVPFALAVDGLGSIRSPASICGCVGLKPTFGRVSNRNTLYETSPFSHNGPIASCVRDAAIVHSIISGKDELFYFGGKQPGLKLPRLMKDCSKYKIGLCSPYAKEAIEPSYSGYLKICELLKNDGNEMIEIPIPELKDSYIASVIHISYCLYKGYIDTNGEDYSMIDDRNAVVTLSFGSSVSEQDVNQCCRQRTRAIKIMERIFEKVDFLLLPTINGIAEEIFPGDDVSGVIDDGIILRHSHFMFLGNLTGVPCITLNSSFCPETKLPIGVQLISKWWTEDKLLDLAYQIESQLNLGEKPSVFESSL